MPFKNTIKGYFNRLAGIKFINQACAYQYFYSVRYVQLQYALIIIQAECVSRKTPLFCFFIILVHNNVVFACTVRCLIDSPQGIFANEPLFLPTRSVIPIQRFRRYARDFHAVFFILIVVRLSPVAVVGTTPSCKSEIFLLRVPFKHSFVLLIGASKPNISLHGSVVNLLMGSLVPNIILQDLVELLIFLMASNFYQGSFVQIARFQCIGPGLSLEVKSTSLLCNFNVAVQKSFAVIRANLGLAKHQFKARNKKNHCDEFKMHLERCSLVELCFSTEEEIGTFQIKQ